ncbi:DUF397 domain-containing protein [Streptomyces sp. NBC_01750]|uniref:DUF397 domain-containing protein n=1 Tax=Streptomyces sp. NBC_01750 TaxID=2975928 RepID=UPI002DD9BF44|nr:DUF397 domain-containing protein [Streptomyces sp. NBC_01750]WSD38153.1 DUF397 domain-containing protein [Streptomyces sp. NBC_01750]
MTTTPPTAAELAAACWKTSSYSAANNECVEVAAVGAAWVGIRDSKRVHGPALAVPTQAFAAVIGALRAGTL